MNITVKQIFLSLLAAVFLLPLPAAAQSASRQASGYAYGQEDLNSAWNSQSVTRVQFAGNRADISGTGTAGSGNTLTISRAGTYLLSGEFRGQILVDAGKNDTVRLVLNGVNISSPSGPALYAKKAAKTILTLAEGTRNSITDTANYSFKSGEDDPDAALFAKDSLTINGGGILTVTGNFRDAIRSKDTLVITGGNLTVTAKKDALRGRDGVAILNGVFVLNAGEDGIQSNNDEDPAKGFVVLDGGTYTIRAGQDGVQAETNLSVTGGNFRISSGDDAIHAAKALRIDGGDITITQCFEGLEGSTVEINGGNISIVASDDAINAAGGNALTNADPRFRGRFTGNSGGNSACYVRISGGNTEVVSGGDGIDANGDVFLEGGTIRLSGPSMGMQGSVDFDGKFVVTGGTLISAGSILPPAQESTQQIIMVSHSTVQAAGSTMSFRDSAGKILAEHTAKTAFSASAVTTPALRSGGTYSLFINGKKLMDITLSGRVSAVSDSGGPYTLGRGGGMGGRGRR
jgi:hypothetical protein